MKKLYFNYACYEKEIFEKFLKDVSKWQSFWQYGQAYMLVPEYSKLKVEEAYLKRYSANSLMLADVKSFLRLAGDIILQVQGDQYQELYPQFNYVLLLQQLEEEGQSNADLLAKQYLETISDLKRNGISTQNLEQFLKEEAIGQHQAPKPLVHFLKHYKIFEETLKKYQLKDKDDRLNIACDLLRAYKRNQLSALQKEALSFLENLSLFIYGFGDLRAFSEQEYAFLKALFEIVPEVHVYMTLDYCSVHGEFEWESLRSMSPYYFSKWTTKQVFSLAHQLGFKTFLNKLDSRASIGSGRKIAQLLSFSQKEELHAYTAGLVWHLLEEKKYRPEEIALVSSEDKEALRFLLKDFSKLKIPYYIDEKKALNQGKFYQELQVLKQFILYPKEFKGFCALLRTAFLDLKAEYIFELENYLYGKPYKGLERLKIDLTEFKTLHSGDCAEMTQKCLDFLTFLEKSEFYRFKSQPLHLWLSALIQFLDERKFFESFHKNAFLQFEEKKTFSLFEDLKIQKEKDEKAFITLLEKLYQFQQLQIKQNKHEKSYTFSQFFSLLTQLASKTGTEAIPNRKGQIYIASLEQCLAQGKKCLIILDSNLSNFPCSMSAEGFLKDHDRQMLSQNLQRFMPSRKRDLPYLSKVLTDRILRNATQGIYLMQTQESQSNPIFLKHLSAYGYELKSKQIDALEKNDLRYYSHLYQERFLLFKENQNLQLHQHTLSPKLLKVLQSRETGLVKYSISQIEKYVQSPFAYFLNYILRLKERSSFELNPALKGNLLHAFFEVLFKKYKSFMEVGEKNLLGLSQEQMRLFAEEFTEEKIKDILERLMTQDFAVFKEDLKVKREDLRAYRQILMRLVPSFLEELYAYESYQILPAYFEQNFDVELEKNVHLIGKIDRIDWIKNLHTEEKAYRIVDYKSGQQQNIDLRRLFMGLDLQLPIYAKMFLEAMDNKGEAKPILWDMGYEKVYWNEKFEHIFNSQTQFDKFYQGFGSENNHVFLEFLQEYSFKRLKEEIKHIQAGLFPLELRKVLEQDQTYSESSLKAYAWHLSQKTLKDFSKDAYEALKHKKGQTKAEVKQANFMQLQDYSVVNQERPNCLEEEI